MTPEDLLVEIGEAYTELARARMEVNRLQVELNATGTALQRDHVLRSERARSLAAAYWAMAPYLADGRMSINAARAVFAAIDPHG